jgi:nucleotide-binding universal stress UspA family protein
MAEGEENSPPISKILVAVDDSERSIKAFDYALKLSKVTQAKVSVVHVIPPPVAGEEGVPAAQLTELLQKEGEDFIGQLKSYAESQSSDAAEARVLEYILKEGNPSKEILTVAKDSGADLIVMGSSGTAGVKQLLLGSVSHAVSNHATCPILIVK